MKHIIVGGVAGGATAAARIRRADESAEIILIEKGKYISYANCGLPYYIGDVITDREKLFVQTPEQFSKQFNIDVRTENEVIAIDPESHSVKVRKANGTVYDEKYEKLLLSPGSVPVKPPIPGIESPGIFTLRNVSDTDNIKSYITGKGVRNAVVVGAGFIGLEMAENLHHAGIGVSIVELSKQAMAPIDFSMAQYVHQHLVQKGVNLYLENGVEKFSEENGHIKITLGDGSTIDTDMVILSIGVRPETTLAKSAGIKIGVTGGIETDEFLQTSVADIYAVGDAIEYPHPLTGKPWLNYLANPANRQGRLVADNMVYGNKHKYEGAIGTAIAKVFDMTVASTGLAAKRLKQAGMKYASSYTHSASHAGYYPGAMPLSTKLTFNPETGQLYGAQVIGYEGVDKRIDEASLIIKNGGTVYDLARIEQAYAPPYSSAKDAIAIAGYAAGNVVSGDMEIIDWHDMLEAGKNNAVILDVRTAEEFSFGAIENAINIPLQELRECYNELPKDRPIYIYCAVGLRGYMAQRILMSKGYTNTGNLSGGYKTYMTATYKIPAPVKNETVHLKKEFNMNDDIKTIKIDACGLQCPGPIMRTKQAIDSIANGERIEITSTDAGFSRDASAWCNSTGNKMISNTSDKGRYTVIIEKGPQDKCPVTKPDNHGSAKTFIMFSDDLDKALATFVLANGAAATGARTTIFFTFWGLNVIKKKHKPKVKKDIFGKMFSMMLPSDSMHLSLSKMSMFGIGDKMMRYIMKRKNIESLESLRNQAIEQGVEFIACQMSMDVMGVKREELLDNVTVGGVATYMERAENANVNLFI